MLSCLGQESNVIKNILPVAVLKEKLLSYIVYIGNKLSFLVSFEKSRGEKPPALRGVAVPLVQLGMDSLDTEVLSMLPGIPG